MTSYVLYAAIAIMIATWVGLTRFIWRYRPFDLRSHGPAGRHLLVMTWALWALYTVSLAGLVVAFPDWLVGPVTLFVLGWICFAVWQRNNLHDTVAGRHRDQHTPTPPTT